MLKYVFKLFTTLDFISPYTVLNMVLNITLEWPPGDVLSCVMSMTTIVSLEIEKL